MKKILTLSILSVLVVTTFVVAGGMNKLNMFEKDSLWNIVPNGASGVLNYNDYSFGLKATGLEPNTEYTLIRYGAWTDVVCAEQWWTPEGNDVYSSPTNKNGEYVISGVMPEGGPKVWVVLSSDVNCETSKMIAWNPTEYLFENNLI